MLIFILYCGLIGIAAGIVASKSLNKISNEDWWFWEHNTYFNFVYYALVLIGLSIPTILGIVLILLNNSAGGLGLLIPAIIVSVSDFLILIGTTIYAVRQYNKHKEY